MNTNHSKEAKTSPKTVKTGYFYPLETVIIYLMGVAGGLGRFATFLKEVVVTNEFGRPTKKCVVRFFGEKEETTVSDTSVIRLSFVEDLSLLFAEIRKQISRLAKNYEKSINYEKEYEEFSGYLPVFVDALYLRSFYEANCLSLEKAIEKNLEKAEKIWENRKMDLIGDMEKPGEIQALKEAYATIKEEILRTVPQSGEAEKTCDTSEAAVIVPVTVIVPAVKTAKESADGDNTVSFLASEAIPITVSVAS